MAFHIDCKVSGNPYKQALVICTVWDFWAFSAFYHHLKLEMRKGELFIYLMFWRAILPSFSEQLWMSECSNTYN